MGSRIPHERDPLSLHLPIADGACGGREAAAYLVEPSAVIGILTSIALVFYLTQGIISGAIEFELEDVDILGRFHNAVYSTLALDFLRIYHISAEQTKQKVKRVVEETLFLTLRVLAAHSVGYA